MKKIVLCLTAILLLFTACEKIAEDTPQAIRKLIKRYNKSDKDLQLVVECQCNEKIIYWFEESKKEGHCYYFYVHIFDKEGNLLCSHGTRNLQDNTCIMEYGDCEETRVIWKKESKLK